MIYSFKESKSKELKRGFQFKIELFANSSVYDLHRQMNISLELNKLYLKKLIWVTSETDYSVNK